ncbi:MAG TPA: sigma-70 family RNA polymerase sigma factor, partial [Pseudoneobacillus sp.]|nr:sigma-70 family RNA polymerase sigma factor [Pseudoneobacillus sp.]
LGIPEDEVCTTINEHFYANILSIDEQPLDLDEKEGTGFIIKDEKAVHPEEKLIKNEVVGELAKLIEKLNEKEKLVVSLFYFEELTLTEIGQVMNLSTSRISQIHSRALFKLNQSLEKLI